MTINIISTGNVAEVENLLPLGPRIAERGVSFSEYKRTEEGLKAAYSIPKPADYRGFIEWNQVPDASQLEYATKAQKFKLLLIEYVKFVTFFGGNKDKVNVIVCAMCVLGGLVTRETNQTWKNLGYDVLRWVDTNDWPRATTPVSILSSWKKLVRKNPTTNLRMLTKLVMTVAKIWPSPSAVPNLTKTKTTTLLTNQRNSKRPVSMWKRRRLTVL